ncbi:hypothetical protein KIN20_002021 [Parelaphostrongylus tenuis]|uniref:Uncharacterized protein n=1 Tax=Parelaphostrongylus tenuis TaxID=148309 RepID=A0AAD5MMZ0_PARTN|nr:hypothetical protein KIN20_002021 [Parelaphostrongylus tenuis]
MNNYRIKYVTACQDVKRKLSARLIKFRGPTKRLASRTLFSPSLETIREELESSKQHHHVKESHCYQHRS